MLHCTCDFSSNVYVCCEKELLKRAAKGFLWKHCFHGVIKAPAAVMIILYGHCYINTLGTCPFESEK